jgi:hypothetical protein
MTFKTKAIVCNGTGGPEVLEQAEVALPWPGGGGAEPRRRVLPRARPLY